MANPSNSSLGKALGTVLKKKALHPIIIKTVAVAVPIAIISVIGAGVGLGSGNSNTTTSETNKYPTTSVIQPACSSGDAGTSGDCSSLIAEVAAKCAGADQDNVESAVFDPPTDSRWDYWSKLGQSVDAHQTIGDKYNKAYASCTQFVEKVVMSTVDQNIWGMGPPQMLDYLSNKSAGKWKQIGYNASDKIEDICKPGDVIATCDDANSTILSGGTGLGSTGHDLIYIGNTIAKKYFPNTDSNVVEAGYSGGTTGILPRMNKYDTTTLTSRNYIVYRFVGTADPLTEVAKDGILSQDCAKNSDNNGDDSWRNQVAQAAKSMVGGTYAYGAYSPDTRTFDCSGLTKWCYEQIGINIDHQSEAQGNAYCTKNATEAEIGDIVWRSGHVGIYIGNGQTIEAMNPEKGIQYGSLSSFTKSGSPKGNDSASSNSPSSSSSSSSSSTKDTGGATGKKITMDEVLACGTDKHKYFDLIMPDYNKYGKMFNIPFPGILAAQTCFECGAPNIANQAQIESNNLGGLGNGVWDGIPGASAPKSGHFAAFETVSDYIYAACWNVATSGHYDEAMAETSDYHAFWNKLAGIWCANPSQEYLDAVISWYDTYNLGSGRTTSSSSGSDSSTIECDNGDKNANANSTSTSASSGQDYASASDGQKRIVDACKSTPSPGAGLCAMWVSLVYEKAGFGYPGGNACDMYDQYCTSKNRSELKVGMMVAVRTHSLTSAGSIYGHIGIYIGDGQIMENIGSINTTSIDEWINLYEPAATSGDGVKWGFGPGLS